MVSVKVVLFHSEGVGCSIPAKWKAFLVLPRSGWKNKFHTLFSKMILWVSHSNLIKILSLQWYISMAWGKCIPIKGFKGPRGWKYSAFDKDPLIVGSPSMVKQCGQMCREIPYGFVTKCKSFIAKVRKTSTYLRICINTEKKNSYSFSQVLLYQSLWHWTWNALCQDHQDFFRGLTRGHVLVWKYFLVKVQVLVWKHVISWNVWPCNNYQGEVLMTIKKPYMMHCDSIKYCFVIILVSQFHVIHIHVYYCTRLAIPIKWRHITSK